MSEQQLASAFDDQLAAMFDQIERRLARLENPHAMANKPFDPAYSGPLASGAVWQASQTWKRADPEVWRPISEAPQDGTRLLLFVPYMVNAVFIGAWVNRWLREDDTRGPPVGQPTHWMPLPAPPGKP